MNSLVHLIVNTIIAIPLFMMGHGYQFLILFVLLAVIIDVDHVFYLAIKYKTVSRKKMLRHGNAMRGEMKPGLYIFHSPEFNILLLFFSFINNQLFLIFLSNFVHLALDAIEHYRYHESFHWFKEWSIINALKPMPTANNK